MCPVRLHRAFRWGLAFGRDRLLWRDVVESEAPSYWVFFVPLARSSFPPAAISGLKSSASQIGRISRSLGPGIGLGHRLAHSTASSIDRTCQIQNPATSSFVSAKGPSVTDRLVPLKWIRFPNLLGLSPSAASMIPALTSSSLYLPICANISSAPSISSGLDSASDSLVAFTITMTRIRPPQCWERPWWPALPMRRPGVPQIDITCLGRPLVARPGGSEGRSPPLQAGGVTQRTPALGTTAHTYPLGLTLPRGRGSLRWRAQWALTRRIARRGSSLRAQIGIHRFPSPCGHRRSAWRS